MTAGEAVERFVTDGAVVGLGGLSIARQPVALAFEVVRQAKKGLTLVGCSLNLPMDLLVGAGLVKRTEGGSGNMEQFGSAYRWRDAVQNGELEMTDYSHLTMAQRFLAGSLGLPFMPSKSLLGSDILNSHKRNPRKAHEVVDNPWNPGEPVVLLPALNPDVSLIHAQKADEMGNVMIEGVLAHEPELARASHSVIVSCEELVSTEQVRSDPHRTTIPYIYVDAVVVQPWGAYPTSTYGYHDQDETHTAAYQAAARSGGQEYAAYLEDYVYGCATFDDFLAKAATEDRRRELSDSMRELM